jgi:hypothetical protein
MGFYTKPFLTVMSRLDGWQFGMTESLIYMTVI